MDIHRQAQQMYERAAALHERAAAFWDEQGEPDKAALEREKAEWARSQAGHEWMHTRVRVPGRS